MRKIEITIDDDGHIDISENGKTCGFLCWDEMIGQIATMTMSNTVRRPLFEMLTADEWREREERLIKIKEKTP